MFLILLIVDSRRCNYVDGCDGSFVEMLERVVTLYRTVKQSLRIGINAPKQARLEV